MLQAPQAKTIIVVPCYNEEFRLPKEKYIECMRKIPDFKILFVDDGSTDNTFQILNKIKQTEPNRIHVLKLERNCGKAEAVRRGFLSAISLSQPEFLGFWDADLATPFEVVPSFFQIFENRPDVEMVLGARVKLMGRDIKRRAHRHYLGRIFATFVSLAIHLKIYDTQCGAKIFRVTNTLKTIFNTPFQSKWIFDVEILARYMKEKKISSSEAENLIYEFPLPEWRDIEDSKLKPTDYFVAFTELVQIYLTYR